MPLGVKARSVLSTSFEVVVFKGIYSHLKNEICFNFYLTSAVCRCHNGVAFFLISVEVNSTT